MKRGVKRATLIASARKWALAFEIRSLKFISDPMGRVAAKRKMAFLKSAGFRTFNQKKSGVIIEIQEW